MLRIGEKQELTVVKEVAFGVYLAEEGDKENRVLLPKKEVDETVKIEKKALLKLTDEGQKLMVIETVSRQGMSVARTEQYIASLLAPQGEKRFCANISSFLRNVSQTLTRIQQAGIPAISERRETESQIVLTITIPK